MIIELHLRLFLVLKMKLIYQALLCYEMPNAKMNQFLLLKRFFPSNFSKFCVNTLWFCMVFALMKRVVLKIWAMGGNSIFSFGTLKKEGGLLLSNKEHLESCSIQHQHNSTQTRVCLVFNFQAHMCFYNAIYLGIPGYVHLMPCLLNFQIMWA